MPTKRNFFGENKQETIKKQCVHRPCPTCVKHEDPAQTTHSRSSNTLCPYRQKNKSELAKDAFDGDFELFTIKVGCEKTCRILGLQQQISIAVEKIRDVTFEASLLANRHFLRCMEERGAVEPNCFNHIFFYTCMQFVCGKNKKCPHGLPESVHSDLDVTYAAYKQLRPDNLSLPDAGPLWHALSAIAVDMEKDARNHMVANFARKAKEYIQILICDKLSNKDAKKMAAYIYGQQAGVTRLWPSSIEKTPHWKN